MHTPPAVLYLTRYQHQASPTSLREIVAWPVVGPSPTPNELANGLRPFVDADAASSDGAKGAEVCLTSTLSLDGVKIAQTSPAAPSMPLPDLAAPLKLYHVLRACSQHVEAGVRARRDGDAEAEVLCFAPTPAAALITAWHLWCVVPPNPSLSPARDLARLLGAWRKGACGIWPVWDDVWGPVAILEPAKQDPATLAQLRAKCLPHEASGLLGFVTK
jgi:hypothetical protein